MNPFDRSTRREVPGLGEIRYSAEPDYVRGETVYRLSGSVRGALTLRHDVNVSRPQSPETPFVLVGFGRGGLLALVPAPHDLPVIHGVAFRGVAVADTGALYRDSSTGSRVAGRFLTPSDIRMPCEVVEVAQMARVIDVILRDWLRREDIGRLWAAAAANAARAALVIAETQVGRLIDASAELGRMVGEAATLREELTQLVARCEG